MPKNKIYLGYIFTISAAICWGFSGACGEFLFQHRNLNPEWATMVRMLVTGSVMLPLLFILKGRAVTLAPIKAAKDFIHLLIFAIIGLASCQYTYLAVIKHSNAGTGTMLQYIGPVFVMIFMCMILRRLPKLMELVSIACVIIGVFFVATHGDPSTLIITPTALTIGIASAVALALYTVIPVRLIKLYGSTLITAWAMFIGGITVVIIFRPSAGEEAIFDMGTYLGLAGLILIGTLFSYTVFLYGVNLLGPLKASLLACIEPISAAFMTMFWFGTEFVVYDYVGFVLILLAVVLVSLTGGKDVDLDHED